MKKVVNIPKQSQEKVQNTPSQHEIPSDTSNSQLSSKTTKSTQMIKAAILQGKGPSLVKINTPSMKQKPATSIQKSTEAEPKTIRPQSSKVNSKSKTIQPLKKESNSKLTLENSQNKGNNVTILKQDDVISTNKYQFLEIFNEQISDHILSFLQLNDFSKFATLSRESRNRIPKILKKLDYNERYQGFKEKFQYDEGEPFCYELFNINQTYLKLIKNKQQDIIQCLESFERDKFQSKEHLYKVLHIGVNLLNKTIKKEHEIIPFILSKGVQNIFKDLSREYLKPVTQKVLLPSYPICNKETSLVKLIQLLHRHISLLQSNKYSLEKQKSLFNPYKRQQYFEMFYQHKNKFIINYNRPIWCMKKTSNVFDYLNKNNIQIILIYLQYEEIINLMLTCKKMKSLVTQGIQSLIEQEQISREQVLQQIQMQENEAKAVMYIKHYETFQSLQSGLIFSFVVKQKPFFELFYALCSVIPSRKESLEILQNEGSYFLLQHKIETAQPDKIGVLDKILQTYTDQYIEKTIILSRDSEYYRREIILLQKYLKGLKLYLELNLRDTFQQIKEKYQNHILKYDSKIHKYELIIKQNKELLYFFTIKPKNDPSFIRKTKGVPRILFSR